MDKEEKISNTKMVADKIANKILLIGLFLFPLFLFPFWDISPAISKKFFLIGVVFVVLVLWLIGRLQTGSLKITKNYLYLASLFVLLSTFISSLLSGAIGNSLIGSGFEYDTFLSMLVFFLTLFLFSVYFNTKEKVFHSLISLFIVSIIVATYTLLTILLNAIFDYSLFSSLAVNVVGKWYELAVFFGLSGLLSLIFIETFPLVENSSLKRLLYGVLWLSFLILSLVNFTLVWLVVGILSLLIFVYITTRNTGDESNEKKDLKSFFSGAQIRRPSFIVVILALLFITLGGQGGLLDRSISSLYEPLDIVFLEVRPSWESTLTVFNSSIKENIFVGAGPNLFSQAWNMYKPAGFNDSFYWDADFDSGNGIIPSLLVAGGGLALLSWAIFFAIFLYYGFSSLFVEWKDSFKQLLSLLTFSGASFMWVMSFIYTPQSIFALAFIMTGLFIGTLSWKVTPPIEILFLRDKKASFAGVLAVVVLVMSGLFGVYFLVQKTWSVLIYHKALSTFSKESDIDETERLINKALNLSKTNPEYYQSLAEINYNKMSRLLDDASLSQDEFSVQFQSRLDQAISLAGEAIKINPKNYSYYMTLGHVYKLITPLNVNGAYEQALASYIKAGELNPKNPIVDFNLAEVEISIGANDSARKHLDNALNKKPNYLNALFVLAQLDADEGKIDQAISRVNQAISLDPSNYSSYFQLGFLRYSNADYPEAISAFIETIEKSPDHNNANARYYLALSYAEERDTQKAIDQLEIVLETNQDNDQVKQIISNLKADRPALTGLSSNETETELPIEEDN